MSAIDDLLSVSRAYAKATGIEMSAVSWRVFGDSKKLGAIEGGSDIQVRRHEKALRWFADNWPDKAPWPPHVVVPALDAQKIKRRKHGEAA